MFALIPLLLGFTVILCGVWLIVRGIRGRVLLSAPHCAKCGYDLRGHLLQPDANRICPECGSDVDRPGAVNFARSGWRPWLVLAGVAVLLLPVLLVFGLTVQAASRTVAAAGPFGNSTKTNATLLNDLKTTADQPWTWQELEARYRTNRLSDSEVAAAVDELIASVIRDRQAGRVGPLPWSSRFLRAVSGSIATTQQSRLYQTFYSAAPTVIVRSKARAGTEVPFEMRWGGPWDLEGLRFVYALREVKLADGTKLSPKPPYQYQESDPDVFSETGHQELQGKIANLPPGKHELVFVADGGVVSQDTPLMGMNGKPGPKARWVKPMDTWSATVKVPVTIVPADQQVIELVEDPAMDPLATGALKPPRLYCRRQQRSGVEIQMDWKNSAPPVPVEMKVFLRLPDGTEERAGEYGIMTRRAGGTTSHYGSYYRQKSLPPDVTQVDVILRPDVAEAENRPEIDRIWGKPVIFKGVQLERYDLPTTAPANAAG